MNADEHGPWQRPSALRRLHRFRRCLERGHGRDAGHDPKRPTFGIVSQTSSDCGSESCRLSSPKMGTVPPGDCPHFRGRDRVPSSVFGLREHRSRFSFAPPAGRPKNQLYPMECRSAGPLGSPGLNPFANRADSPRASRRHNRLASRPARRIATRRTNRSADLLPAQPARRLPPHLQNRPANPGRKGLGTGIPNRLPNRSGNGSHGDSQSLIH